MISVSSPSTLQSILKNHRQKSKRIALVPTMGGLHEGHLKLIEMAKKHADFVVVSLYVNPLQFGAAEDLRAYPQTLEQDQQLCEQAGVDLLFSPESLYSQQGIQVTLTVQDLGSCLCGQDRVGHFDGVVTVVNLLFQIIQPHVAVFGEKDYQQLCVIQRMVQDLWMPVTILAIPIHREADGLAMSTRNAYLSPEQRKIAPVLYQSLCYIADRVQQGNVNCKDLLEDGKAFLLEHQVIPQYLEIRSALDLKPVEILGEEAARIFIAAHLGNARLIDNVALLCS